MEVIAIFLIKFLGGAALMGGVIYLFKLLKQKKVADVIPFNLAEREAIRKAQEDLEKGVKEARARYEARKVEYMKTRQKLFKPQLVQNKPDTDEGGNK